jgi:hypothetical protein
MGPDQSVLFSKPSCSRGDPGQLYRRVGAATLRLLSAYQCSIPLLDTGNLPVIGPLLYQGERDRNHLPYRGFAG